MQANKCFVAVFLIPIILNFEHAEVLLDFVHANEVGKDDWHEDKMVICGPSYMNMVNKQKDMLLRFQLWKRRGKCLGKPQSLQTEPWG